MQASSAAVTGISRAQLHVGDLRVVLPELGKEIAQAVITSPPYWSLRDYQTPPQIWGGDEACAHDWGAEVRAPWANEVPGPSANHPKNGTAGHWTPKVAGQFCECGAWLGSLGLEPTPELFVEHIVECFRAVRLALKPDGLLWVNLGDSYAGSGKGPSNSIQGDASQIGPSARKKRGLNNLQDTPTQWIPINGSSIGSRIDSQHGDSGHTSGVRPPPGYKPKDLIGIPWMVAFALRADGWYLRMDCIWHKPNPMPESVTDRPTRSHEYVFLLSKSRTYYYDALAVAEAYSAATLERSRYSWTEPDREDGRSTPRNSKRWNVTNRDRRGAMGGRDGRNKRSVWTIPTVPFSASVRTSRRAPVVLDAIDGDTKRTASPTCSVHASEDSDRPSDLNGGHGAASVESRRNPGSSTHHAPSLPFDFAPTPPSPDVDSYEQTSDSLLRPGSGSATGRSNGSHRTAPDPATTQPCTPSAQTADRTPHTSASPDSAGSADRISASNTETVDSAGPRSSRTPIRSVDTSSEPSSSSACTCSYYKDYTEITSHFATFPPSLVEDPIKASTRPGDLVLDPFCGAGTVGLMAARLGRDFIGIDLKASYVQMAQRRILDDAPMLNEVTI